MHSSHQSSSQVYLPHFVPRDMDTVAVELTWLYTLMQQAFLGHCFVSYILPFGRNHLLEYV